MDRPSVLHIFVIFVVSNVAYCSNSPPFLVTDKHWRVFETDRVGESVTTLRARDSEGDHVTFSLESRRPGDNIDTYFTVDEDNRVRIAKPLTGLAGDHSTNHVLGVRLKDGTTEPIVEVRVEIFKDAKTNTAGRPREPWRSPGRPLARPSNPSIFNVGITPPAGVFNHIPQPGPNLPIILSKNGPWHVPANAAVDQLIDIVKVRDIPRIGFNITLGGSQDLLSIDNEGKVRVARPLTNAIGNYSITIKVANANGVLDEQAYLVILPPTPAIPTVTTTTSFGTSISKSPPKTFATSIPDIKNPDGGYGSQDLVEVGGNSIAESTTGSSEEAMGADMTFTIIPIVLIIVISPIILLVFYYCRRLKRRRARAEAKESAVIYSEKGEEAVATQIPPRQGSAANGQPGVEVRRLGWADRLLKKAQSNKYEEAIKIENKDKRRISEISSPIIDKWEFPRHHLKFIGILGEGCFGQVWKCEAIDINTKATMLVAVKTLKESAGDRERRDLIQELKVLKNLKKHINVVSFLGCCSEKDPIFIILEYMSGGKLQSYLRASRTDTVYNNLHRNSSSLSPKDLTAFAYQIARGMEFLTLNGIIHRDLAARNVLVGEEKICKVADFGFARDVTNNHVYERKSDGRLPIRWMAPESLFDNIFTTKSDVWSFGVLLWEIVTLGSTPYPGLGAAEVMKKVKDNYRLEKPEHCRREIYNIMYYCWDKDAAKRPSFTELVHNLESLLLSEVDYIELDRFPDHSYYNVITDKSDELL